MFPEDQRILAQLKNPGPLSRAANSIAAPPPATIAEAKAKLAELTVRD